MVTQDSSHQATIENLGGGIQRQWFHDRRIVGIYMTRDGDDALEVWTASTKEAFATWEPGKTYFSLYDISRNSFTSKGINQAQKIAREIPDHI